MGFPVGLVVKNPLANARDIGEVGLILGLGRSPGEGNGYPLQYSCLGNSMDRGSWWATVHGVSKSWTGLKQLSIHTGCPLDSREPAPQAVSCAKMQMTSEFNSGTGEAAPS